MSHELTLHCKPDDMHTHSPRTSQEIMFLPNTMENWPWPRTINPYYEEVDQESNDWIRSFKPFNKRSQYAFDLGGFGLLAALVYPNVTREHLRIGTDLMNFLFVVDAYTDVESEEAVKGMVAILVDAVQNPNKFRPKDENILGEIARQYWLRCERIATPEAKKHFMESFIDYLDSVVAQARDRDNGNALTVDEYFRVRRQNVGVRPAYAVGELCLKIPDHVFYHPVIKELEYLSLNMIALTNDVLSYNKEQAIGDDRYNILTIVMNQFHLSLPDAIRWAARCHKEMEARFLGALETVPSWGKEIDEQVALYIDHVGGWVRANDCWSFESGRYFGRKGLEVQKTRYVPLLQKALPTAYLHKTIPIVDVLYV